MITLTQLEQETARRVGPYVRLAMDRQVPTTATFQHAYFNALRSSVEQDLVANLYLLRRGVDYQGVAVGVLPDDRQRMVANYDPAQGQVEVDRPWSVAPAVGELCEFHHLDPEQELRPAVLGGLRRCFFEDRFSLGPDFIYEADLTEAMPWLTNPYDVLNAEVAPFPAGFGGQATDLPFEVFTQGGHVCIRLNNGGGQFWGGVLVTVARSHFFFVNGVDSTTGPTADTDELAVDLDYAASAGHIEAWHQRPAKLQAAAAGNLQATQEMAAREFTRQTFIHAPAGTQRWAFNGLVGRSGGGITVINA